jgi:three-Cys-motif partner protein
MSDQQLDPYDDREQTWVKHEVLRQYLLRFAVIVGTWRDTITYVDCFSGPWENKTEDYSDTSFGIAIGELKKAKAVHPNLKLRCLFIEKNPTAFIKLKKFSAAISGVEILALQGELEDKVDHIIKFNKEGGASNFPFIFIDPTGWSGFPMKKIAPLLRLSPGEVLVNFMTSHIKRFIETKDQNYSRSFDDLYGHNRFRAELAQIPKDKREDEMVSLYVQELQRQGDYQFVVHTPVFNPQINATHFHLIYASRNRKGLEVFKAGERKALDGMELKRADAQRRKRQSDGGLELFSSVELHDTSYYDGLRTKYLARLTTKITDALSRNNRVSYDFLWEVALLIPFVWENDLKIILDQMKQAKKIAYEGFTPRQQKPKINANNCIVRIS